MQTIKCKLLCYNGLYELIRDIKTLLGIEIYLLTNGVPSIQKNKLKNLKVIDYFDFIFYAKELGSQKPDIKLFNQVVDSIKIESNNIHMSEIIILMI